MFLPSAIANDQQPIAVLCSVLCAGEALVMPIVSSPKLSETVGHLLSFFLWNVVKHI